jgi:hypothetical protein
VSIGIFGELKVIKREDCPILKTSLDAGKPLEKEDVLRSLERNEQDYLDGIIDERIYEARKQMFEFILPCFIPVHDEFIN